MSIESKNLVLDPDNIVIIINDHSLQVIEGGELDIDFTLFDPNHRIVHTESRKMDGLHSFDISVSGEYSICFANEFSRISHKMIYFDIIIEDDSGVYAILVAV